MPGKLRGPVSHIQAASNQLCLPLKPDGLHVNCPDTKICTAVIMIAAVLAGPQQHTLERQKEPASDGNTKQRP